MVESFLSVDPAVSVTGQPYQYVYDDPINNTDPSGLFCWGLCTFTNAVHWVAKHPAETAGIVLGVAAAATGVGAIAEAAAAAGEGVALGLTSSALGAGAAALDAGPCISSDFQNAAACAGAGFGIAGSLGGLAVLVLPEAAVVPVGAWAVGTSGFATLLDIANALSRHASNTGAGCVSGARG